jgi:ATP-dependent DNA helicase RecG
VLDRPAWLARVWQRVREEVEGGRQAYVVCPRISPDEPDDQLDDGPDDGPDAGEPTVPGAGAAAGTRGIAAVEELAHALRDGPLAGLKVAILHGRLTPEEKDDVMLAFAAGEVDVLVATTVIEVGVDVGNATTMVVMDAERFGMSQLHQLRGRVGRGGHPGLCLLVTSADPDAPGRARLDAVASTLDGFEVADLDLQLRKEGDVLGDEQSGGRRTLRLLSVARDADVIEAARAAATSVVAEDPELGRHPELRAAVEAVQRAVDIDYLERA